MASPADDVRQFIAEEIERERTADPRGYTLCGHLAAHPRMSGEEAGEVLRRLVDEGWMMPCSTDLGGIAYMPVWPQAERMGVLP